MAYIIKGVLMFRGIFNEFSLSDFFGWMSVEFVLLPARKDSVHFSVTLTLFKLTDLCSKMGGYFGTFRILITLLASPLEGIVGGFSGTG